MEAGSTVLLKYSTVGGVSGGFLECFGDVSVRQQQLGTRSECHREAVAGQSDLWVPNPKALPQTPSPNLPPSCTFCMPLETLWGLRALFLGSVRYEARCTVR